MAPKPRRTPLSYAYKIYLVMFCSTIEASSVPMQKNVNIILITTLLSYDGHFSSFLNGGIIM
jgi:hypothetical protein